MQVRLLFQPITGQAGTDFLDALTTLSGESSRAIIVTAWAKMSGLRYLSSGLVSFRAAGGHVTVATGIDQSGTSKEAVERILAIADAGFVIHDPRRSFHPKLYVVSGADQAVVLIGSGNLTRGGLFNNYEVFLRLDLKLRESADETLLGQLLRSVSDLLADPSTSQQITKDLVKELDLPPERRVPKLDEAAGGRTLRGFKARPGLLDAPSQSDHQSVESATARRRRRKQSAVRARLTKVLTPNDAGETDGHQSGIAIPMDDVGFFPPLRRGIKNPDVFIDITDEESRVWHSRFVYYNGKLFGSGSRNEHRLTRIMKYLNEHHVQSGDAVHFELTEDGHYRVRYEERGPRRKSI